MTSPGNAYYRRGASRDYMLRTKVTVRPAAYPITVNDVKTNLLITNNSQDDYIASLIPAAVEGAQRALGRYFLTHTITGYLDYVAATPIWEGTYIGPRNLIGFSEVQLLGLPAQSVDSVTIYDTADTAQVVDPSQYRVDNFDPDMPGRITLREGATWPSVPGGIRNQSGFEVVYKVGYGDDPCDVPADITRGLVLLVSYMYNNRGDCNCPDAEGCVPLCGGFSGLLSRKRLRI